MSDFNAAEVMKVQDSEGPLMAVRLSVEAWTRGMVLQAPKTKSVGDKEKDLQAKKG